MNNEIKEILEVNGDKYNVNLPKEVKEAFTCIDYELSVCNCELPKILDCITNLQEKYDKALTDLVHEGHKRIELENKITNLQEENERLKEIVENITTLTVCDDRKQIKNTAQYKLDIAQERIDKAIEYIKNNYGILLLTNPPREAFSKDILLNILQGESND